VGILKKLLILMVFFLITSGVISHKVSASSFQDLNEIDRFYNEIVYLYEQGIITGYSDTIFKPNAPVSRAEVAIMLGRAIGVEGEQKDTSFIDVSKSMKSSGYISALKHAGIISGYGGNEFKPYSKVSRGEMAIMLAKAFELNEEAPYTFADMAPSMASFDYTKLILQAGITFGYPDGTYRAAENVNRAEFAAFVARALNADFIGEQKELKSFKKDSSLKYTYEYVNGLVETLVSAGYIYNSFWDVWYVENTEREVIEAENVNGLFFGFKESEYTIPLSYPIKLEAEWNIGFGEYVGREITATDLTVETQAGIFDNVIETTDSDTKIKHYFVEDIGLIKSQQGENIISELIKLTKK